MANSFVCVICGEDYEAARCPKCFRDTGDKEADVNVPQAIFTPPRIPNNIVPTILSPLEHGIAAMEREALKVGVPADKIINMLLNHMCSVVAMIDPPPVREETIKALVKSFAPMVRQHVEARFTTPGGVKLPGAV